MFRHGKIVVGKLQVGGGGDRSAHEPEYEEVGPPTAHMKKKLAAAQNNSNRKEDDNGRSEDRRKNCDLCGSTEAAVRCERCQSQAFCLACDEMYHKHPRRASHVRKSVESTGSGNMRPPLPPKVDAQGAPPPQPPPRKNKGRIFMPGTNSNEQDAGHSGGRSIMGSLKRFMGSRPLPPTPDQAKGRNTPAPSHPGPSQNSMARRNTSPNISLTSDAEGVMTVNMSGGPVPGLPGGEVQGNVPTSAGDPNSQYAGVGPKTGQSKPPQQQHHNTNSLGRKFSLQQNNTSLSTSRSSMVDPSSGGGGGGWETDSATRNANNSNLRQKSQSISDDQWAQVMSSQDGGGNQGWGPVPGYPDQGQQGRGPRSNTLGRSGGGLPQSRGMVSSASVCDLNTLSQQQQQQPQQPNFANPHMAGSFQHLNMMGMVPWGAPPPATCDVCQGAPMNYPGHQHGGGGMRRAGSNLSMNLSSVGSNEMPGYPWPPPPHMHPHHMPIAYPGYYPGYPPHMVPPPPGSMSSSTGLNISIPDSMNTFGKVPSSPNASVRSSSHRSHKSSKSRSFSAADGRRSRSYNKKRSEESEDSYSSSYSDEEVINERVSKTGYRTGGTLSWQCDHCTFINSGGTRTCGMCSKTQGSGKKDNNRSKSRNNDRSHRSESRKHGNRRTDHDDDPDISDYDNDEVLKSNFTFNIRDNRKESRSKSSASNKTKSRKKTRKSVTRSRAGSPDSSPSGSEEEVQLERQMKDLRVSSSRKQNGEYDGYNKKEKERSSHKKEGGNGRFKNHGRASSERSRTPAPEIPKQSSPEHSDDDQMHEQQVVKWAGQDNQTTEPSNNQLELFESESQSQKNDDTLQNDHISIVENNETQTPVPNIAIEKNYVSTKPERPKSLQLPISEPNVYGNIKKAESINLVVDKSPSPKLSPHKNYSPPHSNRTSRDADDPSFANTLDEIASMGTEVVDYVPSSRYVDHDINLENVENINEVKNDTPVAFFPGHAIQNNQLDNSKLNEEEIRLIEQINKNINISEEIPEVTIAQPEENIEVVINVKPVKDQEPSYELIDEPKQEDEGTIVENPPVHNEMRIEVLNVEANIPIYIPKPEGAERTNVEPTEDIRETSREGSRELIPTPSSSVGSLPADPGQYTPLSYSSSDAFYSPPNSPDVSITDKLEDKPSGSQTQDSNTLLGSSSGGGIMPEEELVTALESVHNDKDNDGLNASRETIRDSVEQLPYTDEEVAAGSAGDRPSSTGAEVPVAKPLLSPTTPTDGYESLSFQDAVSDTHLLQRSLSDKGIASSSKAVPSRHSVAPSEEEIAALEQARQQAFMQEMGQAVGSKQLMTVEEIIKKRKQDALEKQGLEVVRQLREAEAAGYGSEELSIAMNQCGDKDPVEWLKENWIHMVDTVITLATNYEQQRTLSDDISPIGVDEASLALRLQKGNIWEAVTECLNKRNKVDDLQNLVIDHEHEPTTTTADITKKDMLLSDADEPSDELAALTDNHPAGAEEDATIDKNEEIIKLQQNDGSNSEREDAVYYENNAVQVMQQEVSQHDYYDSVSVKDVVVPQTPLVAQTSKTDDIIEPPPSPQVKASAIVGHAIAKAMARETSVRLSGSRSVTPEVNSSLSSRDPTSSSRDPTPISRDPTPDQPIAITPDPITEEDTTLQVTVTDSEEDDLLRTLDTIPEEEEISEMTDTGKISRSSSKLIRKKKAAQITADNDSTVINQDANTSSITPISETHEEPLKITSPSPQNIQDKTAGASSNQPNVSNSNLTQSISSPAVGGAYSILAYGSSSAINATKITTDVVTASANVVKSSGDSDGEAVTRRMVEGLKAQGDEADYAEVHELKEQISSMRKHLEEKMQQGENLTEEEDGARPSSGATTVTDDEEQQQQQPEPQQQPAPTITVQQPPQDDQPQQEENKIFDFDRTVRRLLAEGQAASYEKAELAAQLMTFNFDEKDSIDAAEDCSSMYTAIKFLQQECELCAEKLPMKKMVSMLMCTHRCCSDCAKTYFSFQIKTKNIREVRCPFCNEPDLDGDEEIANEYLNNLDILLKNILDDETHALFQRKLRDWTLMKDPNFKWCSKCSSGFIANPRARKLICPDCKDVTCQSCRKEWEAEHEDMSCEEFAKWKDENELEAGGVNKHIAEYGITCPKCKFKFSLAKGGCMHFTCSQCKYEFCSGCSQPFRQGKKCPVGPYCERLGLHAHHPRNCLFYLRDKEPHQLQQLLKDRNIGYNTELPEGYEAVLTDGKWKQCQVPEQKELPEGLKDDICGRIVMDGFAGLCRLHYTEYLVEIINEQKLDPVSIFDEADLRVCLRRNGKTVPIRRWESEKLYRDKLIKLIKQQLPLDADAS